jgi:hypothetical protein
VTRFIPDDPLLRPPSRPYNREREKEKIVERKKIKNKKNANEAYYEK